MSAAGALLPLRERSFAWFFAGRLISTAGSVMAPVAIVFAVLGIADSPVAVGQVLAARSVTLVLFLLVGGVIADRVRRATVLVVSHLASVVTQGVVAYLVISGTAQLGQLVVLEALNGVATAFTMPAIAGLVPQLVDRRYLQQANALLAFSRSGLAVLGPAVAGTLVVTVGAGWALALDALTWLVAGGCMLFVRVPRRAVIEQQSMAAAMRSGWHVFLSYQWLWTVVLACGVLNAIYAGAWSTLGPTLAKDNPSLGEQGWGFAVSAEAVGLLVMTLVMLRARVRHPLRVGMFAMMGLTLPMVALAAQAPLGVLLTGAFIAGAGVQVFMISWHTAIHEKVPERYQSRVAAYDAVGSFVAIPVGQLAVGPVASVVGESGTLMGSAVLFMAVVAATLGVPAVWGLRRGGRAPAGPVTSAAAPGSVTFSQAPGLPTAPGDDATRASTGTALRPAAGTHQLDQPETAHLRREP